MSSGYQLLDQDPAVFPITCTLEQLYSGCVRKMKITRSIFGRFDSKVFEINIKAGWKAGTKITYEGEGDQILGERPQDIQFVIEEAPNDVWIREGDDIVADEVVSLKQALAGFTHTRMGVDGEPVVLEIFDILSPGTDQRVVGAGMPKKNGGRGDAIFRFKVAFPSELTDEQRDIIVSQLPDF